MGYLQDTMKVGMSNIKIFCFGFGQVAKYFVKKLILEKRLIELNISSRQKTHSKSFEGLTYNSFKFEGKKIDQEIKKKIKRQTIF